MTLQLIFQTPLVRIPINPLWFPLQMMSDCDNYVSLDFCCYPSNHVMNCYFGTLVLWTLFQYDLDPILCASFGAYRFMDVQLQLSIRWSWVQNHHLMVVQVIIANQNHRRTWCMGWLIGWWKLRQIWIVSFWANLDLSNLQRLEFKCCAGPNLQCQ